MTEDTILHLRLRHADRKLPFDRHQFLVVEEVFEPKPVQLTMIDSGRDIRSRRSVEFADDDFAAEEHEIAHQSFHDRWTARWPRLMYERGVLRRERDARLDRAISRSRPVRNASGSRLVVPCWRAAGDGSSVVSW